MVDLTTQFVRVTQPLISMCQAGINKATLSAGYKELKAAADSLSAAMVAKGASGGTSTGEVQLLGSLIGAGLLDTGTADTTNLLLSTQGDFSGLDWISSQITPADSGVSDPFGGSTASTLTETTLGSQEHELSTAWYTAATDAQYTVIAILKQRLRTRALIVVRDLQAPNTNNAYCTYDVAGVQIGVAAAISGAFSSVSATATSDSNGYVICALTFTTNGTGTYDLEIYPDAGSGTGASNATYTGNATTPALNIAGVGVYAGATGTYIPQNSNTGLAASTIQQVFSPNGTTTAYWGTQTINAWVGFDAGVPVVPTRVRVAPQPSSIGNPTYPYTPDYAININGSLIQTDVADSTFASPTTIYTIPSAGGLSYYPRYQLTEIAFGAEAAARYIRLLPPTASFGAISEFQVCAKAGTKANACPVQPVISPNGGRFPSLSTSVSITSLTTSAKIYYTTDGSTPTTSSIRYTGPFTLSVPTGTQVTVKAIAHDALLSTPNSLITTSAPFNGYGYHPNDNWYDNNGILIEAHAGGVIWDPNTSAYYWTGQFMNIVSGQVVGNTYTEPSSFPAIYLYKSTDLLDWTNLGPILTGTIPSPGLGGSRYHMIYNALNNNYVIFSNQLPESNHSLQSCYIATTSGSDITSGWSWNSTPLFSNTFYDHNLFIDSDGVTAYLIWRVGTTGGINIQQLNTSYTALTGSPLNLPSTTREGVVILKYPFATGGTYFIITSQNVPYDSSLEADLRYVYNTGSSPLANTWNTTTSSGASPWASDPMGTNYNGQPTAWLLPQGKVQPMVMLDYWKINPNYASRYVWLPLVMTPTTLQIQQTAAWDPSQLATSFTLGTLTLSANSFTSGNAQGTVIGTVLGTFPGSTLSLTDPHSGACQIVSGVIQVGATPPVGTNTFNITVRETDALASNSPKDTVLSISEVAAGGALSGSALTFTTNQSINLTTLAASGLSDWAAFGADSGTVASIERKATGGSAISTLTQVGATALGASNHVASTPHWAVAWTDGSPDATPTPNPEGYQVFCSTSSTGRGMSFTVPADTTTRTLLIYVWISFTTGGLSEGKLTATLSDASAGPYVDTTVQQTNGTTNMLGQYTITYSAASGSQSLLIDWVNNASGAQVVGIFAAVIE